MIKVGELVMPLGSCAGPPGALRCDSALVYKVDAPNPHQLVHFICHCGSGKDYSWRFEKLDDPEIACSADPM